MNLLAHAGTTPSRRKQLLERVEIGPAAFDPETDRAITAIATNVANAGTAVAANDNKATS